MQLPYSEELNIEYLGRLFDNTSECYKFFWFKAIISKVAEGNRELSYEELVDEMIADAWYMVTEYHLNLGPTIMFAKSLCEELNPKVNVLDDLPEKIINLEDLMIRCNGFYCNTHHDVEDIVGVLFVIGRKGCVIEKKVPLAYCENCNVYYILNETYKELKSWGVIGCQVMDKQSYEQRGRYNGNFSLWAEFSPLRLWGYTVSKKEDLSDDQRQAILAMIVDKGVMSRDNIMGYLDFFIKMNANKADSVYLWQMDRKFIANYKQGSLRTVVIKQ